MLGIVIQARMGSSRLPGKVLLDFHKGETILDLLIDNLKSHFADVPIILATSKNEADKKLVEKSQEKGIHCFAGSENDVLQRFVEAGKQHELTELVRICSDNPFFNMNAVSSLIAQAKGGHEYISFRLPDGTPAIRSHLGLYGEWMTIAALEQAAKESTAAMDHEHVTPYLYMQEGRFDCHWLPIELDTEHLHSLRFTIDDAQDFRMAQWIYDGLGDNVQDVEKLLTFVTEQGMLDEMQQQIALYDK